MKLSPLDNAIAREQAIENLAELRGRLHRAAEGAGITLTANECYLLARHIAYPKRPKGRPPGDARTEDAFVAIACFERERRGEPIKAAVNAVAKQFGISRSSVHAARKAIISFSSK
jgi:hypothetical protein